MLPSCTKRGPVYSSLKGPVGQSLHAARIFSLPEKYIRYRPFTLYTSGAQNHLGQEVCSLCKAHPRRSQFSRSVLENTSIPLSPVVP